MRFLIALVLLTTACKKESKTGAGGASPCEAAVDRGVDQTIAKRRGSNAPAMTPAEADVPKKLKVALAKSCVDDKWSAEVIDCFKTAEDIAACKEKLTPEQRGAYTRAAIGVMQGAGGSGGMPGGMPPHGGGAMGGSAPPGGMPPHGGGAMGGSAPPAGSGEAPAGSATPPAGSGSN